MKRLLFLALLLHSAGVLAYRWHSPLLGEHGFRQSQTAISVFWMLHDGGWLNYWTPVMGPPWTIPFEFPAFQWVVAVVAWCGVPLDPAGRLVSWLFGIAVLWPLRAICREMHIDWLTVACLYLASPLYNYWGTAFLIDTTALFFGAMFLACSLEDHWLWMITFGCLSMLEKPPTFAGFAFLSMVLSLRSAVPWERYGLGIPMSSRPALRSERC